ncbi:hypothetical protein N7467_011932 [Penicillium canescens]|nr:hypothetical protein N7467_011932 [Penicillium canescens]
MLDKFVFLLGRPGYYRFSYRLREKDNGVNTRISYTPDISTFVKHYKVDVDINVEVRFAYSLSASIDLDRPYKLLTVESRSLNELLEREKLRVTRDRAIEGKRKFNKANKRIRENLKRYKNEQPIIDLERQLVGKLVDTRVIGALEHTGFMTLEFMIVIDTILTVPGITIKVEY